MTAAMLVTGASLGWAASNDQFAAAKAIGALPYQDVVDTTGATSESGEPSPCGAIGSTVWYVLTPVADSAVEIDTVGSNFDTVLAVYRGTSLADLEPLACNDDTAGRLSRVLVGIAAGETAFIQAGGYQEETGSLTVRARPIEGPDNGRPATARPIDALPHRDQVNTNDDVSWRGEPSPSCAPAGRTVYWLFEPNAPTPAAFWTDGSDFDTVMAVYEVGLDGSLVEVACNDDASLNYSSEVGFIADAGSQYLVQVGGFFNDAGRVVLSGGFGVRRAVGPASVGAVTDGSSASGSAWVSTNSAFGVGRADVSTHDGDPIARVEVCVFAAAEGVCEYIPL